MGCSTDLNTYKPPDESLRKKMQMLKYKPLQGLFQQNHDLAAIYKIRQLRGSQQIRKIENSKAIFLTEDRRLCKFNYEQMEHHRTGTVCEVISDNLLTNILWLKQPNVELSLKSVISALKNEIFVNRRVWDRFYDILRKLKKEGKIEDDQISMLFYHNYIEDELRGLDETHLDTLTPEFTLEKIEAASRLQKETEEKRETEFLRYLREEVAKTEEETNKRWVEKISKAKNKIKKAAHRKARIISYVISAFVTVLLLALLYIAYWLVDKFGTPILLTWIASVASSTIGTTEVWKRLRKWLEVKLFNYFNKSMLLKELDLP